MFVWRPSVLLKAVQKYLPNLATKISEISEAFGTDNEYETIKKIYDSIERVSIDVGVMEQADNVFMFKGDGFAWSDVGSWSSWSDSQEEDHADKQGNIVHAEAFLLDTKNTTIVAKDKFVAAIGLEDTIVVDTGDALLVCPKSRSQDVKKIVESLNEQSKNSLL